MSHDLIFCLDEALARVDHDRETFHMMIELFAEHGPKDLADAETALKAGNTAGVALSSHKLKGAILQFCAPAASQACRDLEEAAKAGNLAHARESYAALEKELRRLLVALRHVLERGIAA